MWKMDSSGLSVHAGKGQQGAVDGNVLFAEFSQPYGICCEARTQYVTDASTGCVKLVTTLDGTTEFLKHFGNLYRNFGVQETLDASLLDAKTCLENVTTYLKICVSDVQQQLGTGKVTNGPEGTVSRKTSQSCKLMLDSIIQLLKVSVRSLKSRSHKCGQPPVAVNFGCGESACNDHDQTPST